MTRWSIGLLASMATIATASVGRAQGPAAASTSAWPATAASAAPAATDARWELTVDGRVGFPIGRLRVGEFPIGASRGAGVPGSPGTNLRLHDLGIDVSEAVEGSAAFHLTPRHAVRMSYLYYFLDGRTTLHHSVFFNGPEFLPGPLTTNADFYRLSLDYEGTLLTRPSRERLVLTIGLTYVNLNPTLTGTNRGVTGEGNGRSNSEDFYRQELPVPIVGLRWNHPLTPRLLLRTSVSGGGVPRIDSLRTEGGGVYLRQSHADADLALAYALTPDAELAVGYHFAYFFQEEKSKEDKNTFELIDNGLQFGVKVRF